MRENAHDDVFKKSRSQLALMSDFQKRRKSFKMCKQVEIITMKYARKCIKIFWQNISKFNDFGCHSYLLWTSAINQIKNCYLHCIIKQY